LFMLDYDNIRVFNDNVPQPFCTVSALYLIAKKSDDYVNQSEDDAQLRSSQTL